MTLEKDSCNFIIYNMSDGFASHKALLDNRDKPIDYVFLDTNKAFAEITGLKKEDIIGKKLTEVLPNICLKWIAAYEQIAHTGKSAGFEQYFELQDRWYEIAAFSEKPNYFTAILRDITERKRVEVTLLESKNQLQAVAENFPEGSVVIYDRNFRYIFAEGKGLDDADLSREMLLGKKPRDIFSQKFCELLEQYLRDAFNGQEKTFEIEWAGKYFIKKVFPLHKSKGETESVMGVIIDITGHKRVEEKLQNSQEQLQAILNFLPDATFVIDLEGKVLVWNKAIEEMTGIKEEEILGKDNYEYTIPFYGERRPCLADMVIKSHPEFEQEYSFISQKEDKSLVGESFCPFIGESGVYIWAKATPIFDSRGKLFGAIESIRDITERKLAEVALQESEKKYREILATMEEGYYEVDLAGNFVFINDSFCKLTGYSKNEVMYNSFKILFKNPRDVFNTFNPVYRTGRPEKAVEWPVITKSGREIHVEISASLRQDSEGKPLGFRGVARDITDRKKAEKALWDALRRLDDIIEFLPDATVAIDLEGRVIAWNKAIEEMTGILKQEMMGKGDYEYALPFYGERKQILVDLAAMTPTEQYAKLKEQYDLSHISGDTLFGEVYCPETYGGKGAYLFASASKLRDASGNIVGAIETIRDITDRKKDEEEIRTRNEELSTLYTLSTHMRTATSSSDLLPIVLKEAMRLLRADDGMIILLSQDQASFTVSLGEGYLKNYTGQTFPSDQGPSGIVLRTGKPYVSTDYNAEPYYLPLSGAAEIGPVVFVPLQSEETLLGILAVSRRRGIATDTFSPAEVHLLTAIGEMVGNALRRQRLHESAQERMNQLQALRNIDNAITGSQGLNETLEISLAEVTGQLNADAAAIMFLESSTGILSYKAWRGFLSVNPGIIKLRPGEGCGGKAVFEGRSLYLPDLQKVKQQDPAQKIIFAGEGFVAYFAVPLIANNNVHGVLEVFHRKPLNPGKDWLDFMETLAGQVAIAVENDRLFKDLEHSNLELAVAYDATIEGWVHALDLKDKETEGHSQRVMEMTLTLAAAMGVCQEKMPHIRRGALLHDIGKMGIPDTILLKPGGLTEKEWTIMRQHPGYAFKMLSHIEYLRPALNIPYCHHEKWNGTGYPRRLKNEAIPLEARIFSVVDVFDALTSDRPYRPAWTREHALEYISRESGRHFDPQVVKLFLQRM